MRRRLHIKCIFASLISVFFYFPKESESPRQGGGMQLLHIKCICGKITHTLNATEANLYENRHFRYKVKDITGVRWGWLFEHARLISFPSLWTGWQDCGMRAQVHRNMHFTLGYSRWEVKCSIKWDINARRWNAWMPAPRESAGILLTGKMSAFCTRRRNSGIWTTLRESGKNAGILVFDQFAKENMTRFCSNFGAIYTQFVTMFQQLFVRWRIIKNKSKL